MRELRRIAIYPQPMEDVWVGLTDRQALAEWLMPTTFETPRLGHKFRFQYDPDFLCPAGTVECEIVELEPPHRMVWSWTNAPREATDRPSTMRVEWRLTPHGKGTRLELIQTGLEGQPWLVPIAMGYGWRVYLRRYLPAVLRNVCDGTFEPGAIPRDKRAYRATNLPPDVAV